MKIDSNYSSYFFGFNKENPHPSDLDKLKKDSPVQDESLANDESDAFDLDIQVKEQEIHDTKEQGHTCRCDTYGACTNRTCRTCASCTCYQC